MKLSKPELNEYIGLYLNDLNDYGGDQDHYLLAEQTLSEFSNLLTESKQDVRKMLNEAITNSDKNVREVYEEFLMYIQELQDQFGYLPFLSYIYNKNKMKKQILSEEFSKMKKLAGITTENVSGNVEMDDETYEKIDELINPGGKLSADWKNFIDSATNIMDTAYNDGENGFEAKEVYDYLFTILENEL